MKKFSSFLCICVVIIMVSCNPARNTAVSNTGGIDLSSINPGRFDTTWWNREPYRLVQTNLREIDATMNLNTMLESITKGAGGCWSLDVLAPKIVKGDYSPGFSVDNFVKDLTIGLEEAEAMKLSLPGLALVKQLYITIQAMDKGSSGNQALYLALEKLSNLDNK